MYANIPTSPSWQLGSTTVRKPWDRVFQTPSTAFRLCLVVALLLLLLQQSGSLLRMADPTAAVVDLGVLSLLLLAILAGVAFVALGHWLSGLLWPVLRKYPKYYFPKDFKSLLPWQKITFHLVIFFAFLYAFVWLLSVIF